MYLTQGSATATQFQASTVTSTIEQVITTTTLTTVAAAARFRRQNAPSSPTDDRPSPTSDASPSDSLSASENEVSVITNVLTFTTTQVIVQTKLVNFAHTMQVYLLIFLYLVLSPPSPSSPRVRALHPQLIPHQVLLPRLSERRIPTHPHHQFLVVLMVMFLPMANHRLLGTGVSSAIPFWPWSHSLTSPTAVVADNASTRAMHTTVQNGVTVIISKVVTEVGGAQTTVSRSIVQGAEHALIIPLAQIETPIQTLLNTVGPLSPSERGGIIAGGVIGGLLIVIGLLTLIFFFRRRRLNQTRQMAARQKRLATPRRFLEDELAEPMRQWDDGSSPPLTIESSPRLLRPRGSSTGSLFREDVWPPPQEAFHDPIMTPHDLGSTVSLVMGPPPPGSPVSPPSHRSSNDEAAVAVTTATAVGAGKRAVRAYDTSSVSSSSIYSYDNQQPELSPSRAMSTDPLLPRQTSPTSCLPPMRGYHPNPAYTAKMQEAANQRSRAYRRSTLSESFTPEEIASAPSSFPPSSYPRLPQSRKGYSAADAYAGSSPDNTSEDSELLRAVLTVGSSTDLASVPRNTVDPPTGASAPANGSVAPTPLPDDRPPEYGTI